MKWAPRDNSIELAIAISLEGLGWMGKKCHFYSPSFENEFGVMSATLQIINWWWWGPPPGRSVSLHAFTIWVRASELSSKFFFFLHSPHGQAILRCFLLCLRLKQRGSRCQMCDALVHLGTLAVLQAKGVKCQLLRPLEDRSWCLSWGDWGETGRRMDWSLRGIMCLR